MNLRVKQEYYNFLLAIDAIIRENLTCSFTRVISNSPASVSSSTTRILIPSNSMGLENKPGSTVSFSRRNNGSKRPTHGGSFQSRGGMAARSRTRISQKDYTCITLWYISGNLLTFCCGVQSILTIPHTPHCPSAGPGKVGTRHSPRHHEPYKFHEQTYEQ